MFQFDRPLRTMARSLVGAIQGGPITPRCAGHTIGWRSRTCARIGHGRRDWLGQFRCGQAILRPPWHHVRAKSQITAGCAHRPQRSVATRHDLQSNHAVRGSIQTYSQRLRVLRERNVVNQWFYTVQCRVGRVPHLLPDRNVHIVMPCLGQCGMCSACKR